MHDGMGPVSAVWLKIVRSDDRHAGRVPARGIGMLGLLMPFPTFVVAGAQKCGTSTLHSLLQDHPHVLMSRPKELHFFDRHWERGLDWYASQFTPGPDHQQFGESTPVYMYDAVGRQRMIETLPEARIVVILRDPIKRAYSHYRQYRNTEREPAPTFESRSSCTLLSARARSLPSCLK